MHASLYMIYTATKGSSSQLMAVNSTIMHRFSIYDQTGPKKMPQMCDVFVKNEVLQTYLIYMSIFIGILALHKCKSCFSIKHNFYNFTFIKNFKTRL